MYSTCTILTRIRSSHPITDHSGRVIAVLAGQPDDPTWNTVNEDASNLLEDLRPKCKLTKEQCQHRRGKFPALSIGISYGGGQQVGMKVNVVPLYSLIPFA